jgi:CHASE1-domain containing sensor protein
MSQRPTDPVPHGARARARRPGWAALTVLGVSLAMSVTAVTFVSWSVSSRDELRFEYGVRSAQDRITMRLEMYHTALRGAAGLFTASDTVTAEDFRAFADKLDLPGHLPGIRGIGWTERTEVDGEEATEATAIRYLEPLDARNRAAIGFDMYSEAVRRQAMARARDTGEAALSGRVTLLQEIDRDVQAGFLLYLPVYRTGTVPPDLAARRAALQGYVYAPFRADDLFAGIFGTETAPAVSFRVRDGDAPAGAPALLHIAPRTPGHTPRHHTSRVMDVSGHPWVLDFASEPALDSGPEHYFAPATGAAGLLVSLVIFLLVLRIDRSRAEAEAGSRAKVQFLATMSHELRTPLNAVGGYVDLIEMEIHGPVTDEQRTALGRIRLAGAHLLGLIEDVLSFARIEAGRTELALGPVGLRDVGGGVTTPVLPQDAAT